MKVAIIAITEEGNGTAQELAASFKESQVYFLSKPNVLRSTVEEIFDRYEGLIFIMALGIVVRVIAPFLRNKYVDPGVVAVDESRRFAISVVSGHEGGANQLAVQVASILGADPVVTTASETRNRLIIGVGCRKGTSQEEILEAIGEALKEGECSIDEIRCVATIDLKGNEPGLKEACRTLGIPLRTISFDLSRGLTGLIKGPHLLKRKSELRG